MSSADTTELRSAARRRMMIRRRRSVVTLLLLVILAAVAYVAACALTTLPSPRATLSVEAEAAVAADAAAAQAVVDAQPLPTAIGWADGEEVWSNDDTAYPLASVSKLLTVLVCLEAQPLEPGADGPTYLWTAEDRARQEYYLGLDGVAYPIPVGTEITLRQMLQFIFLPSANDYAAAYAYWTFGDNDAFLTAVDAFAAKHGLDSVNFVEPTGMDDDNRASAGDLVRIARIALQNPTVLEFTGMSSAEMPWGIGLIENTNPLLGDVPGVIGLKTGALNVVGYNLVLAQRVDALGREVVNISVTLARPSKEDRAASGYEMLTAMAPLPQHFELVAEGEEVGSVLTITGERIALVTAASTGSVLLPGEAARRTVDLLTVEPGAAGSTAGTVRVATPTGDVDIPVVTAAEISEPDLWWRLTHPALVFGWAEPSPADATAAAGTRSGASS